MIDEDADENKKQAMQEATSSARRRETAVHVRISDILSGAYTKKEGWEPNTIDRGGFHFSRVNLLGVIVSSDAASAGPASQILTLDDGSGQIKLRSFDARPLTASVGNLVVVIGRPREFNGERYVLPEIIRKLDNPRWVQVRKIELDLLDKKRSLLKELSREPDGVAEYPPVRDERAIVASDDAVLVTENEALPNTSNPVEKILGVIHANDSGTGVAFEEIAQACTGINVELVLRRLVESGDVFELRAGHYKVLE